MLNIVYHCEPYDNYSWCVCGLIVMVYICYCDIKHVRCIFLYIIFSSLCSFLPSDLLYELFYKL